MVEIKNLNEFMVIGELNNNDYVTLDNLKKVVIPSTAWAVKETIESLKNQGFLIEESGSAQPIIFKLINERKGVSEVVSRCEKEIVRLVERIHNIKTVYPTF